MCISSAVVTSAAGSLWGGGAHPVAMVAAAAVGMAMGAGMIA